MKNINLAEVLLQPGKDEAVPVVVSVKPFHMDGITGICMIVTDLTDQKLTQDELKARAERVETKNRELQEFAFVASHDLQEPIRKIQIFGDFLLSGLSIL